MIRLCLYLSVLSCGYRYQWPSLYLNLYLIADLPSRLPLYHVFICTNMSEHTPLVAKGVGRKSHALRAVLRGCLVAIFIGTLTLVLFWYEEVQHPGERGGGSGYWWSDRLPKDPKLAAGILLKKSPVIVSKAVVVIVLRLNNVLGDRMGT